MDESEKKFKREFEKLYPGTKLKLRPEEKNRRFTRSETNGTDCLLKMGVGPGSGAQATGTCCTQGGGGAQELG